MQVDSILWDGYFRIFYSIYWHPAAKILAFFYIFNRFNLSFSSADWRTVRCMNVIYFILIHVIFHVPQVCWLARPRKHYNPHHALRAPERTVTRWKRTWPAAPRGAKLPQVGAKNTGTVDVKLQNKIQFVIWR